MCGLAALSHTVSQASKSQATGLPVTCHELLRQSPVSTAMSFCKLGNLVAWFGSCLALASTSMGKLFDLSASVSSSVK